VDWYGIVPKDFVENLKFRVKMRKQCESDPKLRKAMMDLCRNDVLFFFSSFCWLHEPRPMRDDTGRLLPEVIPFIPWEHQEPLIRTIREHLGEKDIGVEKSRTEGVTWIALLLALQDWLFAVPGSQRVIINIASRTVEMADTPDDLNSLMAKLDWELEQLPEWMTGPKLSIASTKRGNMGYVRRFKDHTLFNVRNKALISVYAGTAELGSGGRCRYWFIDELSKFEPGADHKALTSTQATTHSRLIVGTPYGQEGAYADIMRKPSRMIKLVMQWQDNPTRNRGLYRMVGGVPVAMNPATNPLPTHYNPPTREVQDLFGRLRQKGFRLEKGVHSPWYDNECDAPDATPFTIAQELDRDYGGSLFTYFTEDFFIAAREAVRPPFCRVNVLYDDMLQPSVNLVSEGHLALWMKLDARNRPPDHLYIVAADICTGLGGTYTSNSVLEIIDAVTSEQVGELAVNTIIPDKFADLAVAVCYWLGNAYLAWERNGPGAGFTMRVKEIGYPNVYLRTKLWDKRRRKKIKEPGWWTDGKSKEVMCSELNRIVATRELKVHSDFFVKESTQYIRIGKSIQHAANARADVEGPDVGENHGDRVIAMGVGVQALRDRPLKLPGRSAAKPIEPNSIEERDREYAELAEKQKDDWDGRSNWDLMAGRSR